VADIKEKPEEYARFETALSNVLRVSPAELKRRTDQWREEKAQRGKARQKLLARRAASRAKRRAASGKG